MRGWVCILGFVRACVPRCLSPNAATNSAAHTHAQIRVCIPNPSWSDEWKNPHANVSRSGLLQRGTSENDLEELGRRSAGGKSSQEQMLDETITVWSFKRRHRRL